MSEGIISLQEVIIQWIYKYYGMPVKDQHPDIVINSGDYFYVGKDCEDLIYDCAALIGLPAEALDIFPYDRYFEPEPSPLTGLYFILLSPILISYFVFFIVKKIIYFILRIRSENICKANQTDKEFLTAAQFANIMVNILENYHQEQKLFASQLQELSVDQREAYRQHAYRIIMRSLNMAPQDFSPDMVINMGQHIIPWWKRRRFIKQCEGAFALPKNQLYDVCMQNDYFEFGYNPIIICIYLVVWIIHVFCCRCVYIVTGKWLYNLGNKLKPLTAMEFADIIIAECFFLRMKKQRQLQW